MSLKSRGIGDIPAETAAVARAVLPNGNVYMQMRDQLGTFYCDADFEDLYPERGQPALAPWRLALVLVMQFAEGLSDRQAAEAVRVRLDWKYALGLELTDPGFDFSVLSEFRSRLLEGDAERRLLDRMLDRFSEQGLLKARGRQRTDSTHVLTAARVMRRLEGIGETLRAALNALAATAPEWVREQVPVEWFDRYSKRMEDAKFPTAAAERQALAETFGADGYFLFNAIQHPAAPPWLRQIPAVEILRQVWLQQFVIMNGVLQLRDPKDVPPSAAKIDSPYETEARFANKRTVTWVGYRVHLTETCDPGQVHLITNVETTCASPPDHLATEQIHEALAHNDLLPAEHLVDSGYLHAGLLVSSEQTYHIDLIGPIPPNTNWQARANQGFDNTHFQIDWDQQRVICPEGQTSIRWRPSTDNYGNPVMRAHFSKAACRRCPSQPLCTHSPDARSITLRIPDEQRALDQARARQETPEFKSLYAQRAGIEGTISQGVRRFNLRRSRYAGQAKTHLQNILVAAAINLYRVYDWFCEVQPAQTRKSHFARLAPQPI